MASDLTKSTQDLEEGEHITVEARSLQECLEMMEKGEICDGKTILGILWYKMKLMSKSGAGSSGNQAANSKPAASKS